MPKPVPAETLWSVQMLTTDRFIEGQIKIKNVHDEEREMGMFSPDSDPAVLVVYSPRIQSIGRLAPVDYGAIESVCIVTTLVALIPADEASLAAAKKSISSGPGAYRYPLELLIHAGPYLIQGQALFTYEDFRGGIGPVLDARIHCLVPGSPFADLNVPYALVRGHHMESYVRRLDPFAR